MMGLRLEKRILSKGPLGCIYEVLTIIHVMSWAYSGQDDGGYDPIVLTRMPALGPKDTRGCRNSVLLAPGHAKKSFRMPQCRQISAKQGTEKPIPSPSLDPNKYQLCIYIYTIYKIGAHRRDLTRLCGWLLLGPALPGILSASAKFDRSAEFGKLLSPTRMLSF